MTLSPDIKHTIASHTAGLPEKERLIRARNLIKKYSIEKQEYSTVAFIACVKETDL